MNSEQKRKAVEYALDKFNTTDQVQIYDHHIDAFNIVDDGVWVKARIFVPREVYGE